MGRKMREPRTEASRKSATSPAAARSQRKTEGPTAPENDPIRSLIDHPSRAGRFSAIVVRAALLELISWDTAAEWLYCTETDARRAVDGLSEFYADVFAESATGAR